MNDTLKALEREIIHMVTWARSAEVIEATQPPRYTVQIKSCDDWTWSKDYTELPTAAQVAQDLTDIRIGTVEKAEPYAR